MPRQKAGSYDAIRITDFTGGLKTGHPSSISDDALVEATNVVYTVEGKITPREGVKKRFKQDFSSSPVVGMAPYYKADGTTRLVIASGTALYVDKPHLTFMYDTQTDWEQNGVCTNADTSSSPGDVKLTTPPAATFLGTATYDKVWF